MNGIKLFKKFMMPCGLCAAVPAVRPNKEEPVCVSNESEKKLIRPSELPIYTCEKIEPPKPKCKVNMEPNTLEKGFGSVRKVVQGFLSNFTGYTDYVSNAIETGKAHSKVTLDYLREETNVLPRIGAVGVGGLSGLILGLRGGKFKKLVYTSTGALVVASICYPKQAEEGMSLAKYYINVGYNFFYGVKPGEANQLEISWPEMPKVPKNLSDITELASSAASTAASGVGTLFNKATEAFNEFSKMPTPPGENKKEKEN